MRILPSIIAVLFSYCLFWNTANAEKQRDQGHFTGKDEQGIKLGDIFR